MNKNEKNEVWKWLAGVIPKKTVKFVKNTAGEVQEVEVEQLRQIWVLVSGMRRILDRQQTQRELYKLSTVSSDLWTSVPMSGY